MAVSFDEGIRQLKVYERELSPLYEQQKKINEVAGFVFLRMGDPKDDSAYLLAWKRIGVKLCEHKEVTDIWSKAFAVICELDREALDAARPCLPWIPKRTPVGFTSVGSNFFELYHKIFVLRAVFSQYNKTLIRRADAAVIKGSLPSEEDVQRCVEDLRRRLGLGSGGGGEG